MPFRSASDYQSPLAALLRYVRGWLTGARQRGGQEGRLRIRQLEIIAVISVQAGLAAALAAWLARDVLGNPNPVFAPTAAVGTIVAALGQRARRTLALLLGLGLGLLVGDVLIFLLGSGPWQTGVIVALSIGAAYGLTGRPGTVVSQVGGTAVLIATLSSSQQNLELPRALDAATGSAVGLVVVALLVPINPIRIVNRVAAPVFHTLTAQLRETAAALRVEDSDRASRALAELRAMSPDVHRLGEAISGAREVVAIAPARWPRREDFGYYAHGMEYLIRLVNDCRGLARRAATGISDDEPLPGCLADAVDMLADAVWRVHRHAGSERTRELTRRRALQAVETASRAHPEGVGPFGDAIVTQLRVAASDLIRVAGYSGEETRPAVAEAARRGASGQPDEDGHRAGPDGPDR